MTSTPSPAPPRRESRDLFGKRSVLGAIGVVAVLCVFGFGIQAVDEAVKRSSGFTVGSAYQVSPTTSFTPAAGWVIDPAGTTEGQVVTATKNGWTIKLSGVFTLQPGQTVEEFAKLFRDGDAGGDKYSQVGELESFTTTSGQTGVTYAAYGTTEAAMQWNVANGTNMAQLRADGSAANLDSVQGELEEMARSIVVETPTEGSGS